MKRNGSNNFSWLQYIYYLPVLICVGIVPLIVKTAFKSNPLQEVDWYMKDEIMVDFFLYHKGIMLVIGSLIMILVFAYYYVNEKNFVSQTRIAC